MSLTQEAARASPALGRGSRPRLLATTASGGRGRLSGPERRAPRGPAPERRGRLGSLSGPGGAGTGRAGAPRALGTACFFYFAEEEARVEKVQEEVPEVSAAALGEGLSVLTLYL